MILNTRRIKTRPLDTTPRQCTPLGWRKAKGMINPVLRRSRARAARAQDVPKLERSAKE